MPGVEIDYTAKAAQLVHLKKPDVTVTVSGYRFPAMRHALEHIKFFQSLPDQDAPIINLEDECTPQGFLVCYCFMFRDSMDFARAKEEDWHTGIKDEDFVDGCARADKLGYPVFLSSCVPFSRESRAPT